MYHWVQVGPWCFERLADGCVAGAPLGWRSHRGPAGKHLPSEGSCRGGRGVHAHVVSRRTPHTGMHQQSSFPSRRPLTPPHSLSSWRVHVGDSAGQLCCSLGGDRCRTLRLVHSCDLYVWESWPLYLSCLAGSSSQGSSGYRGGQRARGGCSSSYRTRVSRIPLLLLAPPPLPLLYLASACSHVSCDSRSSLVRRDRVRS